MVRSSVAHLEQAWLRIFVWLGKYLGSSLEKRGQTKEVWPQERGKRGQTGLVWSQVKQRRVQS